MWVSQWASSNCGGLRAGARRGASVGKPRWVRILLMASGSSMQAMRRNGPPHLSQDPMSCSKTWDNSWA